MVHLNECFDSNGFETISPDSFLINEEYININFIYNKKIKNIFIFYFDYIDYMGKEKTINYKYHLLPDGMINIIINSLSECNDNIIIYVSVNNGLLCQIILFKIYHIKNDNYLNKNNIFFENKNTLNIIDK